MRMLISAFLALIVATTPLFAQTPPDPVPVDPACPAFVPSVSKNCTTDTCEFDACWQTPQTSMTGCAMLASGPTGALPPVMGTVNSTKTLCAVTAPKLPQGVYGISIVGTNQYGQGPRTSANLTLNTGPVPGAAFTINVK